MTSDQEISALLDSPSASYWLKDALVSAIKRDCVDAAADAAMLSKILTNRQNEIIYGTKI